MEPLPGSVGRSLSLPRRRLRRVVLARRRPLAAVLAGLAVLVGLQAAAPAPPPTRTVLTAAHDLGGGVVLGPGDLARTPLPPESVPDGSASTSAALLGRTTAGPVRAGEPITDVRLVSGSLLDGYPGSVAAPVRVGDHGAVALLRIGDRVDVIAADPQGDREAVVVAADAPVVAIPRTEDSALASGGLVVLAVGNETARDLAAASVSAYLSVVLTG
ncbi:MAG TPA: SAF domain-containing protein [Nocardioidaceae bacterium]|nr:SAF domain-containing protein [Nocardioidaceae bacterium]